MKYRLFVLMFVTLLLSSDTHAADPKKAGGAMGGFAVKVVAVPANAQTVLEKVAVIGSLAANEAVDIKSEIDGNVADIKFEEGQEVKKGDALILLDSQKLQASLDQSKASLSIAQATFDRMKTLVETGAVSRQEFDQAKATLDEQQAQVTLLQARLEDTVIKAPFDGSIGERKVSPGQVIAKDAVLTFLINDNPMKVEFHVPERYLGRLALEQKVNLKVAAYANQEFQGEVYFIDPQVNDVTRTALVKAKIDNADHLLKRGMFAKLDLVINEKPDAVVIPETAIISNGEQVMVFVVDNEKKAQMKFIKTGIRFDGMIEVTEGLVDGDLVITEGFQKIGPGSLVDPISPEQAANKEGHS